MLNIFFLIASFITSIYSFEVKDFEGNTISFSQFKGKSILIVNIATGSNQAEQLSSLALLQDKHADSLVVIAFPSNSFSNEPKTSHEIASYCRAKHNINFIITEKISVTGDAISPLYRWLASKSENGMLDGQVKSDFQKFLIDREGNLIGIFSSDIDPLNEGIIQALSN